MNTQVNRLGFGNAKSSPECQWVDSKQIPIRPMADCCLQTRQHAWAPSPRGFQCPEPLLEEAFVGRIDQQYVQSNLRCFLGAASHPTLRKPAPTYSAGLNLSTLLVTPRKLIVSPALLEPRLQTLPFAWQSGGEVFAEHRTAAGRSLRFVLDHVPMLDKNAIFESKNIDHYPVSGIAIVRVAHGSSHNYLRQRRADIQTGSMLAMNSRT